MDVAPTAASHRGGARSLRIGSERLTTGLLMGMVLCAFFSIALMQILLALAFLNWSIGLRRPDRPAVKAPLALLMIGFVLLSLVSALSIPDAYSAKKAISSGLPMLGYLVALNVLKSPARLHGSLGFIATGGALAGLLGLGQALSNESSLRIAGSLSHYMTYSGVLMLSASVALAVAAYTGQWRTRSWFIAALLPIIAALLLTQTRGAWVGLAAGAAVVLGLRKARLLLLLPVVAVLLYTVSPAHVQARIRSTVDTTDITANERYSMWSIGMEMISDHPLLGVGPRRTGANYEDYRPVDDPFRDSPKPGHLHNNVVEIAAGRGLPGLLVWLALWLVWFFRSGRTLAALGAERSRDRTVIVASLAALTSFQVMGVFEFNMGDSEVSTLALFLMALPFAVEGRNDGASSEGESFPAEVSNRWSG